MKKIIISVFVWFVLLNLINLVSFFLLGDRTSYELPGNISLKLRHITVPWLNFDGRNYLKIAIDGYDLNYLTDLRVFFPLYPLLVKLLSFNIFLNPVITGLVISVTAFVAAVFVFDAILKEDKFKENKRLRILLSLLVFPTGFYFMAYYTESLFLLLALLVFYFIAKKNFFAASLVTAVATATRVTGLALVVPLVYEMYIEYKRSGKFYSSVFLAPLGFILYAVYIQLFKGGALSIVSSQKNWDKPLGIFGPFIAMKDGFWKFLYGSSITHGDFYGRSMEVLEFIFAIILLVVVVYSYKKIKMSYWLYMTAAILPIFFSGVLSSVHRYMAVMFPIYIYVGTLPKKYFNLAIFISSVLLLYLTSLFLRGYWVA